MKTNFSSVALNVYTKVNSNICVNRISFFFFFIFFISQLADCCRLLLAQASVCCLTFLALGAGKRKMRRAQQNTLAHAWQNNFFRFECHHVRERWWWLTCVLLKFLCRLGDHAVVFAFYIQSTWHTKICKMGRASAGEVLLPGRWERARENEKSKPKQSLPLSRLHSCRVWNFDSGKICIATTTSMVQKWKSYSLQMFYVHMGQLHCSHSCKFTNHTKSRMETFTYLFTDFHYFYVWPPSNALRVDGALHGPHIRWTHWQWQGEIKMPIKFSSNRRREEKLPCIIKQTKDRVRTSKSVEEERKIREIV